MSYNEDFAILVFSFLVSVVAGTYLNKVIYFLGFSLEFEGNVKTYLNQTQMPVRLQSGITAPLAIIPFARLTFEPSATIISLINFYKQLEQTVYL